MAGPGPVMGCHLYKVAVHVIRPRQAQLSSSLIQPGHNGPSRGYLQSIHVTGRIDDSLQSLPCQILDSLPDHRLVRKCPAGQLQPGPVKSPLKLLGGSVGGGGRQVFKGAACLLRPGVEQVEQGGGVVGVPGV